MGARGRGHRPGEPQGQPHRRVRRHQHHGLPGHGDFGSRHERSSGRALRRHRQRPEHRDRPGVLRSRPRRAVDGDRHRLLVLAGRHPPGRGRAPAWRGGPGSGRRRPCPVRRTAARAARQRGNAVAHGPVLDLRRGGRRLRLRRGLRPDRPQAAQRRAGGRRPDLGCHSRLGGQSGRRQPGPDRAQRSLPGEGDGGGPGAGRRLPLRCRLPGDPRHRHDRRRSHRAERGGSRLRTRARRRTPPAGRFRQDEHRTSRTRRRRGGPDQGGPGDETRGHSPSPELQQPEPQHRLGPPPRPCHRRDDGLAPPPRSAPSGRRQLVRLVGNQRPRAGAGLRRAGGRGRLRPRFLPRQRPPARQGPDGAGRGTARGTGNTRNPPPAALGQIARGPARRGRSLPVLARRRDGPGPLRPGLDGLGRKEPLRAPGRPRLQRYRSQGGRRSGSRRFAPDAGGDAGASSFCRPSPAPAATGGPGRRRRWRSAPSNAEGGLRLHRPGQSMARHGQSPVRTGARVPLGARPL